MMMAAACLMPPHRLALAPAVQKEIPGIEHVTRVFPGWGRNFLFTYKDKHIYEQNLYRVDSSFFDVFTFPFVEGNAKNALKNTHSVILTQSTAKKYFGKEDPMGKYCMKMAWEML
jgi:putative ABC transport system permease protein